MTGIEDLTTEERIALLTQKYSAEAGIYERCWAAGLREMGRALLDRLDLDGVRAVLDVGAGVGALLGDISERAPEATVVGSDRAEGMVARAPRRFGLAVADAIRLPFPPGSFDLITMVFMLFHLPHPVDGLQEARRILRRGGRAASTTWGEDETWPALEVWSEELGRYGAAEPEGLHSLHEYVDTPEKMAMHLRDAGFGDIETWTGRLERRWDVESFVERATGMAIGKRRYETLDPAVRPRFLETATERIQALPASALVSRSEVIFAVGTRVR
jgi:ubiquinone/menaquinone biosynthesis C-methylase UbiE